MHLNQYRWYNPCFLGRFSGAGLAWVGAENGATAPQQVCVFRTLPKWTQLHLVFLFTPVFPFCISKSKVKRSMERLSTCIIFKKIKKILHKYSNWNLTFYTCKDRVLQICDRNASILLNYIWPDFLQRESGLSVKERLCLENDQCNSNVLRCY